ncbi:hypothetical protein ACWDTG_13640 [Rhodococcus zopfii]
MPDAGYVLSVGSAGSSQIIGGAGEQTFEFVEAGRKLAVVGDEPVVVELELAVTVGVDCGGYQLGAQVQLSLLSELGDGGVQLGDDLFLTADGGGVGAVLGAKTVEFSDAGSGRL